MRLSAVSPLSARRMSPMFAISSAVRTTATPGGLWMRAASGWLASMSAVLRSIRSRALAGRKCLGGNVPDEAGARRGARHVHLLRFRERDGALGQLQHAAQRRISRDDRLRDAVGPGRAQLARCGMEAEKRQSGLARDVDPALECRKQQGKQVAQAGQAAGLVLHRFAAPTDQKTDVDIDLALCIENGQAGPGACQLVNRGGIARV